jgi:hypothetical protein
VKNKTAVHILLIVLMCLVFTSCSKKETENVIPSSNEKKEVPKAWNMDMSKYDVKIPYEVPKYKPAAEEYEVSVDLSNLFNAGQYKGFTESQLKSINEDGFVVLKPSYEQLKLHQVYEFPLYKESPVFITVDSALHLYHIYYDNSLKLIEVSSLYDKLYSLSAGMLTESLSAYQNPGNKNLSGELKDVSAYFLTAARLIGADIKINIPSEISTLSDKEINLINEASDFAKSPVLKKDLDYSQFTVRGHYAGNKKLEKYFKTMMWYGLCGFPVFDETKAEPVLDMESLRRGMIITCLLLENEENYIAHENIYSTTSLYAGTSDDLGIYDFRNMITKVYGQNPDMNLFRDSSYDSRLLEEAKLLPEPKIQPKLTFATTPAGRQFRFMGQRYSFDAEVLQNLMEPILRPVPSGLDVAASFGSIRAEEILDKYYEPKKDWAGYEAALNKMRKEQTEITDDEWKKDLYKGWLWSIKSSAASFKDVEGMPHFMRNEKWTDKNIHTSLGSYAELKHDSILYMKQAVAEMGGGEEIQIPYNYVEPNVEVFAKLKWLAENTKENLKARDMLDDQTSSVLDNIIEIQDTLMKVSVKELTNQQITEEENGILYRYGGQIDYIIQNIYAMFMREEIDTGDDYTSALIADIATIAPNQYFPHGQYLEIGNGLPCEIYVVCRTNGKSYLAKGALFNYYEFLSAKRLTDQEWHNMIGVRKYAMVEDKTTGSFVKKELYDEKGNPIPLNTDQYYINVEIGEPSSDMVSKPEWTNSFISQDDNNVKTSKDMELDWWK